MEQWRIFFESSGTNIWTVIEQAITVAYADFPQELRLRRDGLTERMFAPHLDSAKIDDEVLPKGPHRMNGSGVYNRDEEQDDDDEDPEQDIRESDHKAEEFHDDAFDDEMVEALSEEMEEERLLMKEIASIKEMIKDIDQPEAVVMEQFHRLEDLNISVEALKETEIGKEVNAFRKHPSKRVQGLSKKIVRSWRDLVDEWVKSASDISAAANGQANADMGDEEVGLPSPPLDEGALLAARTVSLEMSQLFDFTDDDLSAASGPSPPTSDGLSELCSFDNVTKKNPSDGVRNRGLSSSPFEEHEAQGSKSGASVHKMDKHRPVNVESKYDQNHWNANITSSNGSIRKAPSVSSGVKPSSGLNNGTSSLKPASGRVPPRQSSDSGVRKVDTGRPSNLSSKPKVETTKPGVSTKPKPVNNVVSEAARLEASKRKLHENYHNHELAKKQRTVQSLDLTELPKGGPKAQRLNQQNQKPGQNRAWLNGRR